MNPRNRNLIINKPFATFFLFLSWCAQVIPLTAFSAPAVWRLETLQNASSEWWQTLTVETVPGVVYHLQKSETLAQGGWNNIASTYGNGEDWVCPVFPGTEPLASPPPGTPVLPTQPTNPIRMAFLVLEKTAAGSTLVSWSSLDDLTPRRELLAGITLHPAWDDFNTGYFNFHGNYVFGISPRLASPVAYTASSSPLGPLDAAMLAAFAAALPTITVNIQNSVANAANYTPQPENSGNRAFYRFAADWSVDSDGDGRFDWQEIIFDGNNPFVVDSDGDGNPDTALVGPSEIPTLDNPAPARRTASALAASPLSPQARIEMLNSTAGYFKTYKPNHPDYDVGAYASINGVTSPTLAATNSYAAFQSAFDTMPPPDDWRGATYVRFYNFKTTPYVGGGYDNGYYAVFYGVSRKSFRLHLDAPAPYGGYSIPLRLAKVVESIDPDSLSPLGITSVETVELMLEVAEGESIGTEVDLPVQSPGENEQVTFIPATVELYGYNLFEGDHDITPVDETTGVCITPAGRIQPHFNGYGSSMIAGTRIFWQKRLLSGAGTMGAWSYIYPVDPAEDQYEGDWPTIEVADPGIYQLQAVLSFPNGQQVEFPYLRMRNAKSINNSRDVENELLKAGQPDYFGVVRNDRSIFVRDAAIRWLGSTAYSKDSPLITDPGSLYNPGMKGKSKCNLFVTHIANSVGATTPYYTRWSFVPTAPLAREDWFGEPEQNVDLDSPGWVHQGVPMNPAPGMSVASPRAGGDALGSGHVGILDYDGSWINAGKLTVNKSVHLMDSSADYKPNNMRSR